MKRICLPIYSLAVLCSCGGVSEKSYEALRVEKETLAQENTLLKKTIQDLKYPATDRYKQVLTLVSENKFADATNAISELKTLFPLSDEAKWCEKQEIVIADKLKRKEEEQERKKALGYKIFSDNTSFTIGAVSSSLSGFTFGRTYTYDFCSDIDEYTYRTADKDNIYFLFSLILSNKGKDDAKVPDLAVYELKGSELEQTSYVSSEYASWSSYGAKLGNYHDNSHDFSKVNSIKYKLSAEVSLEQSQKPLFLLVKKDGSKPEYMISSSDALSKDYIVVKIMNKNKM